MDREYIYKEVANALVQLSQRTEVYMLDNRQMLLTIAAILLQLAEKEKKDE